MSEETATFVEITEVTTFYVEKCKALEGQVSELIKLGDELAQVVADDYDYADEDYLNWMSYKALIGR